MTFDARKESGDWIAKWIDGPDLDPEDVVEVFESLGALLTRCHDEAVKETEERCIELVCDCCSNGNKPIHVEPDEWQHQFGSSGETSWCDVAEIHERRRRREQG